MCNNLYILLLQYFDSPKKDDKNRQDIELQACKYAITTLIPLTENRIYNCEQEYMPKYYELWEKAYAFAGRRSLEHFIDYMEMDMPVESRVFPKIYQTMKRKLYKSDCVHISFLNLCFHVRISADGACLWAADHRGDRRGLRGRIRGVRGSRAACLCRKC